MDGAHVQVYDHLGHRIHTVVVVPVESTRRVLLDHAHIHRARLPGGYLHAARNSDPGLVLGSVVPQKELLGVEPQQHAHGQVADGAGQCAAPFLYVLQRQHGGRLCNDLQGDLTQKVLSVEVLGLPEPPVVHGGLDDDDIVVLDGVTPQSPVHLTLRDVLALHFQHQARGTDVWALVMDSLFDLLERGVQMAREVEVFRHKPARLAALRAELHPEPLATPLVAGLAMRRHAHVLTCWEIGGLCALVLSPKYSTLPGTAERSEKL